MPVMTPEQIAGPGSEHAHQCALMQWVATEGLKKYADLDMLHAIPNGGGRTPSVASAMRAEGVKPGVPDLCLPIPIGIYPGLYIEMKKPDQIKVKDGGRSQAQIKWHKRLRSHHFAVVLAYSWASAVVAIEQYYGGKLTMTGEDAEVFFERGMGSDK